MSSSIESVLNADIINASGRGQLPNDPVGQICYYTSVDMNPGKANFVKQSNPSLNEVLHLRLHVLNGDYDKVQNIFKKIDSIDDNETKAEFCLAECQSLCHRGLWLEAVTVAEKGLRLQPIHITQISLIQCRAIALYELGHLANALKDCEMVISQQNLYNKAIALKYALALKIKILIALGKEYEAEPLFDKLMTFDENQTLDLDLLLTLLRLKIDFYRSKNKNIDQLATACREIATRLQDPLYVSLAEFDFYTSLKKS